MRHVVLGLTLGISVAEYPADDYYCDIIYEEYAGACFGNFCD